MPVKKKKLNDLDSNNIKRAFGAPICIEAGEEDGKGQISLTFEGLRGVEEDRLGSFKMNPAQLIQKKKRVIQERVFLESQKFDGRW